MESLDTKENKEQIGTGAYKTNYSVSPTIHTNAQENTKKQMI